MNKITKTAILKDGSKVTMKAVIQSIKGQTPYFSITGTVYDADGRWSKGGCVHEEIAEAFPEFEPLIEFHLCDINGLPMHYVANSAYWFRKGNLNNFMEAARFNPELDTMPDEENILAWLESRKPRLKQEFTDIMTNFGFDLTKFNNLKG